MKFYSVLKIDLVLGKGSSGSAGSKGRLGEGTGGSEGVAGRVEGGGVERNFTLTSVLNCNFDLA